MKKISLIFALFVFTILAKGQAPDKINYQGVLRDANGNIMANKSISGSIVITGGSSNYTFSIPSGSSTNSYGLFNLEIGPINGVDWSSSSVTITSTITYIDANNLSQTITNSTNPDQLVSVPYALFANQLQNYPKTGTDGYYLKWDASTNNGNGSWVAAPGSTLPTNANVNQVLTWDGNAWIAQDNDGNEPDDQMSTDVMLNPPDDYNDDQIDETTVQEALTAIQGQLGSSNSSSGNHWTNATNSTNIITNDPQANVGIGVSSDPEQKLHIDGLLLVKNTSTMGSKSSIVNVDPISSTNPTSQINAASLELINDDPNNSNSYSHFELANLKNDDGTNSVNNTEIKQDEFKIRRNIHYSGDPMNQPPPVYSDYLTIEGEEAEIGILTSNPHATLSVKGNTAIGTNFAVYDHSVDAGVNLPTDGLIVEGKTGIGTMNPQSNLDIKGSVRIGSSYSGNNNITTDPTNGLIVEGTVGIGKSDPSANYKMDIDGKVMISTDAADGGALKIGSSSQTSGDAVLITGTSGQNALHVNFGNTELNGNLKITNSTNSSTLLELTPSNGLDVNTRTDISGDLTVNGNKMTVQSSSGNLDILGNFGVNTNKFNVNASSGNTNIAGTLNVTGIFSFTELYDGNLYMLGFVDDDSFSNATEATLPSSESVKAYVDNKVSTTYASGLANALTAGDGVDLTSGSSFNGTSASTISVDVSDFMSNGVDNRLVTATGTDDLNAEGNLTFDGTTLDVTGKIVSNGIEELSDKRWKKGITPIDHALEKVKAMNGVYYYWRKEDYPEKNFSDQRQIGFIAQDLELLLPESVHTNKKGYKSVSYGHTVSLLVEAIKELELMIQKQADVIQQQQIDIQQLKSTNSYFSSEKGQTLEK